MAVWTETRWSARQQQWQTRLRYDVGAGKKDEASVFHPTKTDGPALLSRERQRLEGRLRRASAPAQVRQRETTLGQFWDEVVTVKLLPTWPPGTQDGHAQTFRKWVRPYLGGLTFQELADDEDAAVGYAWLDAMRADGAGVPTMQKAVAVARGLVTDAMNPRIGYLRTNVHPLGYLSVPAEWSEQRSYEFALELEHCTAITAKLPAVAAGGGPALREWFWAELVYGEGLRQQEAAASVWGDFFHPTGDLRSRIRVQRAVSGRGSRRRIKELKTKSGLRFPEFFPAVQELCLAYWQARGRPGWLERPFDAASWDGLWDYKNWLNREFTDAVKAAGFQKRGSELGAITPHRLRAAHSSALGYAGWDELRVRTHLGHAELTVTLESYYRAAKDPRPDLEGLSVDEQIRRARAAAGLAL